MDSWFVFLAEYFKGNQVTDIGMEGSYGTCWGVKKCI